jgi:excinuclease ABC subunit A
VLSQLVDQGNTVIVIEHNLDVIKTADWLIDLGPDGGNKGGRVVAEGTPEEVTQVEASYTGRFLEPVLRGRGRSVAPVPSPSVPVQTGPVAKPARTAKTAAKPARTPKTAAATPARAAKTTRTAKTTAARRGVT